jgi:GDP-4-dehydro-6-deoxy-D-mannose reductase
MTDGPSVDLITGADGFSARHLAKRLRDAGKTRICGMDRWESVSVVDLDSYAACDLRDGSSVAKVIREVRPTRVFHLAGQGKGPPGDLYSSNVVGTVVLIEALRQYCPEAEILLVGSAAEYGRVDPRQLPIREDHACRPEGAYGISKHVMTTVGIDCFKRHGMKIVVARPFNILGPGISEGLLVGALVKRIRLSLQDGTGAPVRVGNVDTERDYVSVADTVDAYLKMMSGGFWGEVFNVCSGVAVSVRTILDKLSVVAGVPIRFEVDASLVRPDDVRVIYGSHEKATQSFGFVPNLALEALLRETWEHSLAGSTNHS